MKLNMLTRSVIAMVALAGGQSAFAAHEVIYASRTEAFVSSAAHQGPFVQQSTTRVINGTAAPGSTFSGPGGSATGGGTPAQSSAQATQPGGAGTLVFGNSTYAAANLATGILKAATSSYGPENFGSPAGAAQARLDDTIFFTNSTGGDLAVSFTYRFDGRLFDNVGTANPGGNVSLILSCDFFRCYNGVSGNNQAIRFAGSGNVANSNMNYYFNDDTPDCFGDNIYCGPSSAVNFETGLNPGNGVGGLVDGWITANLLIPTGLTSLGLRGTLDLDCRAASSCDFGHTGQFGFGALPDGLTFGSASGVFLSALAPVGAVPEPASWAMLLFGFGLIGFSLRARTRAGRLGLT